MAECRPVLLGLDDPVSSAPHFPLFPTPNSPGHKLLLCVRAFDPDFTETDYLRYFERLTLSPTFPALESAPYRYALWGTLASGYRGRTIVCLGKPVWAATNANPLLPAFELMQVGLVTAGWIPHPAGKNRFYNTEANRLKAGKFLRGLIRRG